MNHKSLPSVLTLINLLLGVVSLIYTMNDDFRMAALLILLSMILDGLDGKLARRLDASSAFGKELDSLSDLVSFGVAPAILVYALNLKTMGFLGLVVALAFAICGAIRLARFNVLNITTHFLGIPITAAGSLIALLALLAGRIPDLSYPIAMVLLSYLMVSNIKFPKY